ncbi:hypothetical protein [Paraburkholderia sp. BR14320]|uniref:hypothetical protein n=1 Tax=unclassified Paraburkholderia TaxID=2615204 RepID=UPI0034CFF968
MQYVFSMTSRMVTIAVSCALLLCVLLFLLGMEIGARMNRPPAQSAAAVVVSVAPQSGAAAQASLDTGDLAVAPAPASSTP